jgi:acetyltransferase-like isoleucine patch superfamily enzyme
MLNLADYVTIEQPFHVDETAMLGYLTGRSIPDLSLNLGPGANIRSGTVLYAGSTIGAGLQTGHNVVIREQNIIGDHVEIWSNSIVDYGCRIGDHVKIHSNVYIAQFTTIEDEVFLAPGVTIANDPHPLCHECTQENGPLIRRRARIGINVTILPGVVIGESALIGAGTVVTKDVPAKAVVYGNPGRVVKSVDEIACPHDPEGRAYVDGLDRQTRESIV